MKKSKRKSNRRLVSKETIRQAIYAKEKGLLSKRAKLNGGRVSRAVEKKIGVLAKAEAVPTFEFRPGVKRATISTPAKRKGVKVSAAQRKRAKEAGLLISNGRVVIPKGGDYEEAIKSGLVAGHRPKSDENMYSVDTILLSPEGIHNYADLKRSLEGGKLDKYLNDGERLFSFTIFGYHPRAGEIFLDGPSMVEYLEKYQFDDNEEAFQNFELVTVPDGTNLGPTPPEIRRFNRLRFMTRQDRRERFKKKSYRLKKDRETRSKSELDEMNRIRVARWEANQRAKLGDKAFKAKRARERAKQRKAK